VKPLLALLLVVAPACALADSAEGKLVFGGVERTYVIHRPPGAPAGPRPMVVSLHGRLGQGKGQERLTGMDAVADREGFLLVYPDGIDRSWADARAVTPASQKKVDDVGFLTALIRQLVDQEHADPKRVFVAGTSNGAEMAHTLACRAPELIAAIAPVVGNLPAALEACEIKGHVSVAMFLGTEDPLMPYGGGSVKSDVGGAVLSADASLQAWGKSNGCQAAASDTSLPDVDPADGTRVVRRSLTGCPAGTEVRLYRVEGGGHTWPGGWQYLPERVVGRTSRDLNASEEIWRFFKAHGR